MSILWKNQERSVDEQQFQHKLQKYWFWLDIHCRNWRRDNLRQLSICIDSNILLNHSRWRHLHKDQSLHWTSSIATCPCKDSMLQKTSICDQVFTTHLRWYSVQQQYYAAVHVVWTVSGTGKNSRMLIRKLYGRRISEIMSNRWHEEVKWVSFHLNGRLLH